MTVIESIKIVRHSSHLSIGLCLMYANVILSVNKSEMVFSDAYDTPNGRASARVTFGVNDEDAFVDVYAVEPE